MTKEDLCRKLKDNTLTLDEVREIAYKRPCDEIADLLVELFYALYIECGCDEDKANKALLACLLERWWDELEDV